jgi:hypothetical protein
VRNEEILHGVKEINMLQTNERRANWIGHILCRNCLLKDVNKGKTEGTGDEEDDVSSYWMT